MTTANSPIKVSERTKEMIRLGAVMKGTTQGELVDRAVAQFFVTHRDEVEARIAHVREVLGFGV